MKQLFLLLSAVFTLANPGRAQFAFEKIDGGAGEDIAYETIKTSDGGFAVAGVWTTPAGAEDAYLRKTDANGNIVWEKTYGDQAEDVARGVVQNADGGYTLLMNNNDNVAAGGTYLMKTNNLGVTQWIKKVAPTTSIAFVRTTDGGYAITEEFPNGDFISLIRTNATGDTLWTRHYNMSGVVNVAYDLIETSDGGFAITGETDSPPSTGENDIFLIKTNANGIFQWDKRFGTSDLIEQGYALHQTPDGGYLIGGTVIDVLSGVSQAQLVKTNNAGVASWTKTYNYDPGALFYQIEDLAPTTDGNYIMCGWEGGFFGISGFLLKVNPVGDTLLHRLITGQGISIVFSIIQDVDGEFVASGSTGSTLDDDGEIYYFKTDFVVGTKELQQVEMRLSPNPVPAGQLVSIALEGISAYNLTLFDALGRLVWQKTGESPVMNVPAPAQSGIYALVATTADGRFLGRYLLDVQ